MGIALEIYKTLDKKRERTNTQSKVVEKLRTQSYK